MKSITKAYWLWVLSIFGWLGLHRFYLGKRKTGKLWICTFGILGLGSLLDLLLLKRMVLAYNARLELPGLEKDLDTLGKMKLIVLNQKKYETAVWYRNKERVMKSKIEDCRAIIDRGDYLMYVRNIFKRISHAFHK